MLHRPGSIATTSFNQMVDVPPRQVNQTTGDDLQGQAAVTPSTILDQWRSRHSNIHEDLPPWVPLRDPQIQATWTSMAMNLQINCREIKAMFHALLIRIICSSRQRQHHSGGIHSETDWTKSPSLMMASFQQFRLADSFICRMDARLIPRKLTSLQTVYLEKAGLFTKTSSNGSRQCGTLHICTCLRISESSASYLCQPSTGSEGISMSVVLCLLSSTTCANVVSWTWWALKKTDKTWHVNRQIYHRSWFTTYSTQWQWLGYIMCVNIFWYVRQEERIRWESERWTETTK